MQSALRADGDGAATILEMAWVLVVGGGAIFLAVAALLAAAMAGPPAVRAWLSHRVFIIGAGVVFPLAVLSALVVYTFTASAAMVRAERQPAALRIQVTGELWWWRVRYLDAAGATLLETANEIHLPAGEAVDLELRSNDVIHSFWVPNLAGKVDMIPGRETRLRLRAREPGTWRGQCAEFCGAQHARMALHVVAHPAPAFGEWLRARRAPAASPESPQLLRGQALFAQYRCSVCHTIRGTPAAGALGPDLTHVGSRRWLAAGTVPAGQGSLAAWIAGAQHLKPGSRMPAYAGIPGEDLQALAAYLDSLR